MNRLTIWVASFFLIASSALSADAVPSVVSTTPLIPSSSLKAPLSAEPTLDELGFGQADTAADPLLQAQLEKRAWMLKTHQILGLVTAVPLVLEYAIGGETRHRVRHGGSRNTALHVGLGVTTVALYATTASFAIFAPKPKGIKDTGSTNIHRYLAWIHGSLMVITPILGEIANSRIQHGKSPGSIGRLHGLAATGLLASYGAAMSIMVLNF